MIITRLSRDSAKQDPGGTFESPLRVVDEVIAAGEVERARLLGEIEEARHRLIR